MVIHYYLLESGLPWGLGFCIPTIFNRFGCMATGNMIRELKLQLIIEFL